jgi:phage tail-like protein
MVVCRRSAVLDTNVDVIEYRNGNSKENTPIKLTGLNRVTDVTLRRGLIGSLSLCQWFGEVRNGAQTSFRTVTIALQTEDRTAS